MQHSPKSTLTHLNECVVYPHSKLFKRDLWKGQNCLHASQWCVCRCYHFQIILTFKTKNLQIQDFFRNDTHLFSQTLRRRPRSSTNLRELTWHQILGDDPALQGSCSRSIVQSGHGCQGVEAEHPPPEITASRLGPRKVTLLQAQEQTVIKNTDDAEWNHKKKCATLGEL